MFDGYREIGTGSTGKDNLFKLFILFIFIGIVAGIVVAEYQGFIVRWRTYNFTTLPATNITTSSVTFNGNTSIPATVWFEWGLNGSSFNFKTENMTVSPGKFSKKVSGYGLYPGKSYKYRAKGVSTDNPDLVMTGNTEYFTLESITEIEERNYSKYAENLTKGNLSIMSLTNTITEPYTDRMGLIFWLMLFSLPFVAMFIRGTKVVVPALLALCIGGLIWQFLPPEWTYIAYLLIIVAIAGIIYSIMRSRR
ncbi:MAG: hypothetical protein DRP18_00365 [Candidatus Aenigmatarchaeota archaeon]|nr:MAG: hypothetical protein DRP18_00365 [Candidatus Aenigmarchaeota archaeon]